MSELTVENKDGILVVDSRLIAEELGIEHKTLMENINTHISKIESAFGAVSVEPRELKTTQGNTVSKRVAFLTEDQATFVMTLSRNTDKVIDAKIRLVTAFSRAKSALQSISPELLSMLSNMTEHMSTLTARTQRLDAIDKASDLHKGLAGVVETEVMEIYPESLSFTVREYLQKKGVSEEHLHTMRKRAVMFANQGKQINLPRKGNEYVFRGNDISYLDQALKTVLGLD